MKNHVPDLERCKRLKKKGFPQEGLFYHLEGPEWVSIKSWSITGPNTKPYRAPIVTELVKEIDKLKPETDIGMGRYILVDGKSVVWECFKSPAATASADTLPNALADLWLWLRERGE